MTVAEIKGIGGALQDRSRRTRERILAAARSLFAERGVDGVPVAAIAREARVSVGGVYARFPDKASLVLAVDRELLEEARDLIEKALDPHKLQGQHAGVVVQTYLALVIRFFQRHRLLMREVATRARTDPQGRGREVVREFNRFAHGRLRDCLFERAHEIDHPNPREAAEFGVMMVSAAAREQILYSEENLNPSSQRGRRLLQELTRAYCRYLGVSEPTLPRGRRE